VGQGVVEAVAGAWPAVALVGSYELLMAIIRGSQMPAVAPSAHGDVVVNDPLRDQAVLVFAADLAAQRVPSIRAIRAQLHVGQPRAGRLVRLAAKRADDWSASNRRYLDAHSLAGARGLPRADVVVLYATGRSGF
jgi:hypothetical protein